MGLRKQILAIALALVAALGRHLRNLYRDHREFQRALVVAKALSIALFNKIAKEH